MKLDGSIDDFEDFDRIFETAFQDATATGDRYVPAGFRGEWFVVDAWFSEIVQSGSSFEVALANAQELSRLAKIQQLESA